MNSQALVWRRVSYGSSEDTQSVWHGYNRLVCTIDYRKIKSLESFPDVSPLWVARWQHAKASVRASV